MRMIREDDQNVQHKVQIETWKKIVKIIFKSKKRIALLALFSSFVAILDGMFPLINRYAIDVFFIGGDYTTWPQFVILNIVIAALFGLFIWGFIYQAGIIEAETSYELRKQAFGNLQKLSYSYFDKTPQGWVMARMTSDARRLALIVSWGIVDIMWALLSMTTVMVVLYIIFPRLAVIISIVLPIMIIIAIFFRKLILKQHRIARKHNSQITAKYSEGFMGAKTSKSLSIEYENSLEFEKTAQAFKRASIRAIISSGIFSAIILLVSYIAVATTMVRGSVYVLQVVITIGTFQMFIMYAVSFFEPIMALSRILSDFQNAQASAERIVGLIETKSEITDTKEVEEKYGTLLIKKTENWEELIGEIEFKNVTFEYLKDESILRNFNLKVRAGQSVAFVGHTGSGKTTLINLLARFYEPQEGQILIDDIDYRQRSIQWLHSKLGYVLQNPHLFSTTILENIRYGRLDATDEEVIAAAKIVGANEFIEKIDLRYKSFVGEGGNLLSVGQKQLISFARAVLSDPRILILDEATSSMDSESEVIIQQATKEILNGRTSFIIAHRLSTIVSADLIVVLDKGKIVEKGTHKQLLENRGTYFNLYKNQFIKEKEIELEKRL